MHLLTSSMAGRRAARVRRRLAVSLLALAAASAPPGMGALAADAAPAPAAPKTICDDMPSLLTALPSNPISDGKKYLCDHGINLYFNYIGEVYGNVSGGARQSADYEHRIEAGVYADLQTLVGLKGLTFHVNAYQIAGDSISNSNLSNYAVFSNIAAHPMTELFELWLEQKLFDDRVSIRIGQLAADSEFFMSDFGGLFTNAAFGWPTIFAVDLPSGGPAYPFATPGARIALHPTEDLTFMAAIFNGDPTGAGFTNDPYHLDKHGTDFRLKDPPYVIGELQYVYSQSGPGALPGKIKFGGWNNFGDFPSPQVDTAGVLLSSPDSNGSPRLLGGDWGLYGVIDQSVYRFTDDDPKKGVGLFARFAFAPNDRNEISFYVDGGVAVSGFWEQRPDDYFGLAASYTEVSTAAKVYDASMIAFTGEPTPIRTAETLIEATYNAQIMPGFNVQPVVAYVFRPAAGAGLEDQPTKSIPNAAVFGVRTVISF